MCTIFHRDQHVACVNTNFAENFANNHLLSPRHSHGFFLITVKREYLYINAFEYIIYTIAMAVFEQFHISFYVDIGKILRIKTILSYCTQNTTHKIKTNK